LHIFIIWRFMAGRAWEGLFKRVAWKLSPADAAVKFSILAQLA
jgi:hypothetical protein